jgi:hypothetical protein
VSDRIIHPMDPNGSAIKGASGSVPGTVSSLLYMLTMYGKSALLAVSAWLVDLATKLPTV